MSPPRWARRTVLFLLWPLTLGAQEGPGPPSADSVQSPLRVWLVTIGRGDAVWERFGHNALWIEDTRTGEGAAYNWGIFDFNQVDFIPRLVKGTMLYRMAPMDPMASLEEYRRAGRPVWVQELALDPEQKAALLSFVEWNALPENRWYRYDYYLDNCSTRVRDALDRVLDGQIRAATEADTTAHTYRWHTRRLLRDHPPAYLGIQFVLGPRADRRITAWEEMFLPQRMMERLRSLEVRGPDGRTHPLVSSERLLIPSPRPPEPESPPLAWPWFLTVGLVWGLGILGLAGAGKAGALRRLGFALLGGGWAVLAGLSGLLLLGAWLFTDHTFWYRNYNLLQANPLYLGLAAPVLFFAVRGRMPLWGLRWAAALAGVALLGAAVEVIPGLGQSNGEMLALTLPLDLSLGWACLRLRQGVGR